VTLRAAKGLASLRSEKVFKAVRGALREGSKQTFRVVQFSVQTNHVHLIVEAKTTPCLARGMQGLCIRLAKAVNRVLGRYGSVWSDRYHARALRTPREVRNALAYVLLNARKHGACGSGVDPCSSAPWFKGWIESVATVGERAPVVQARTWLLSVGWRRGGSISLREGPAGP